ncbi:MAG: hypothetical protein JSU68_01555 [Phycisphaerales bacterium]|nr:MAG: hypothetical protein JSU68_01555 [Phycisphaerales bacterium]
MNIKRSFKAGPNVVRTVLAFTAVLTLGIAGVVAPSTAVAAEAVNVYPTAGGTIADGGIYGTFDGSPDNWDWTFNQSGYEGAITLTTQTLPSSQENRVVWEYDLRSLSLPSPLTATLVFIVRGGAAEPMPDAEIHVYSFPSDLMETAADFGAGPAMLRGSVTVAARQAPTEVTVNVTDAVREAVNGTKKVAFRLQINPSTPHAKNQAFIDALDSDYTTKPRLSINEGLAGDFDGDGHVTLVDFATFAVCFSMPVSTGGPGCSPSTAQACDLNGSGTVDLADFSTFALNFGR